MNVTNTYLPSRNPRRRFVPRYYLDSETTEEGGDKSMKIHNYDFKLRHFALLLTFALFISPIFANLVSGAPMSVNVLAVKCVPGPIDSNGVLATNCTTTFNGSTCPTAFIFHTDTKTGRFLDGTLTYSGHILCGAAL